MSSNKTKLIHHGRGNQKGVFPVNPPVMRASTILFDNHETWLTQRELRKTDRVLSYGARGTTTNFELEKLITELEGGYRAQLFPTGLAALGMVLLHYAHSGSHILISDGIYNPVRLICKTLLKSFNVTVEYIKADCSDLEEKIRPETDLLLCETPASVMYEMIDLPKVCEIAHRNNVVVAVDNTYGSGYFFNPLKHGADISIIAATKYLCGHSDVVMGIAVCNEDKSEAFCAASEAMGFTASPDDAYLILRGMRTLDIRMRAHEKSALKVAEYLLTRDEVSNIFHPALPTHEGHDIWKRDYHGSNGMLTIELDKSINIDQATKFIDNLKYFGIGASWGGFESLVTICDPSNIRSVSNWNDKGILIRFHIGLEDSSDLIADIDQSMHISFSLLKKII